MLAKIEELDWMKSIDETDTQLRHGAVRLPFVPVNGSLPSGSGERQLFSNVGNLEHAKKLFVLDKAGEEYWRHGKTPSIEAGREAE
ncbi:unnamed protein product [Heligmosomoides polygyrus]|uniref:Pyridoxamine 5'-phosphate oxidase family protein n=1 Tax=Heligmosomoides polygyrus TaxID=6339 RepID=A0A183GI55_HELPZ|nr:unnamed protein product [Heligmosomoides polygyrus]